MNRIDTTSVVKKVYESSYMDSHGHNLTFQRQLKYKVATSFDSKEYAERRRPEGLSDTEIREKEPIIEEDTTNLEADNFAGREVGDIGKDMLNRA